MEHLEIITIIGGIIVAVLASWGGVYFNNRHQFKAQKENHERRIKTEVFAKTVNTLSENRSLIPCLYASSAQEVANSIQQNGIPPEFYLWASDETIQAALDLWVVIVEETSHLLLSKSDIEAKQEVLNVIIKNQHSDELFAKKESEIYILTKKLAEECRNSYARSEIAEIKMIACVRREYGTSFNEEVYRKMADVCNNQCAEITSKHGIGFSEIQDRMIVEQRKYSRASHN